MTTKQAPQESREEIEAAAADFLQRRRFENWGVAQQIDLDTWLRESDARRVAFWRLEATMTRIERLAALRAPARAKHASRLRFMMPFLASAVSLSLIAALGLVGARYFLRPLPDRSYSTDVGGRTLLSFADHTEIELDTNTAIRYRMTTAERTVWLEKGQAWFHVAHDAAHPFTVVVGSHRVTDLGTEFVVRRGSDQMVVALVQGRASLSTEGAQTAMLLPGDEAIATPVSMSVTRKTPEELADELAWRRGALVFRNARLADAVREFNRYNTVQLVIADPAIAGVRVSAEIKTDHYDDLLQLAQSVMNLRTMREGNKILIFRESRGKHEDAPK